LRSNCLETSAAGLQSLPGSVLAATTGAAGVCSAGRAPVRRVRAGAVRGRRPAGRQAACARRKVRRRNSPEPPFL